MIEISRRRFLVFAGAAATLPFLSKYLGPPIETVPAMDAFATTVPAGTIFPYAGSPCPQGWLPCCGQVIARTQCPKLYEVIGTVYGRGPFPRTFRLPDLRGRAQRDSRPVPQMMPLDLSYLIKT